MREKAMNIQRFIEKHKARGLSQSELAKGICTQVTASCFEKGGQAPTLKISVQLYNRLGLPLRGLSPHVGIKQPEILEKTEETEFFLVTNGHDQLQTILKSIPFDEIRDSQLLLEYYYLQGFVMTFQNASLVDCLFTSEKLLFEKQKYASDIYHLLAFAGIGMVYAKEDEIEEVESYFGRIFKKIYLYTIQSVEDTRQVLNVVSYCGVFYAEKDDLETSDVLLEHVISIYSDNHVTYYLARIAFQLAKNTLAEEKSREQILELLQDTRAYAEINKSHILLETIQTLEETILSKNN